MAVTVNEVHSRMDRWNFDDKLSQVVFWGFAAFDT